MGRCPFHEERTPSFSVNGVDKLYYCFGCGAKGDLITFVRETEGLDFAGAIEWLGERFRVAARVRGELACARRRAQAPRAALRAARPGGDVLRAHAVGLRGRRDGARLPQGSRPRSRTHAVRSASGSRSAVDTLARKALAKGFTREELARRRPDAAARRRLLLAPPALPARGRARPRPRFPGSAPVRRRPAEGEVREHPRIGALPQGLGRLRARQGARRDRTRGSRVHRRGQHRRDRSAPGGPRAGRREHGHRADRGAAEGAGAAEQAALARVRRRRGGRDRDVARDGARGEAGLRRQGRRAAAGRRPCGRPERVRTAARGRRSLPALPRSHRDRARRRPRGGLPSRAHAARRSRRLARAPGRLAVRERQARHDRAAARRRRVGSRGRRSVAAGRSMRAHASSATRSRACSHTSSSVPSWPS